MYAFSFIGIDKKKEANNAWRTEGLTVEILAVWSINKREKSQGTNATNLVCSFSPVVST